MSFLRPISNIPQISVRPPSILLNADWLKTAEKVGLAATVVIAAMVAFTKFSILPAIVFTGITALLGFAAHSCFQRCFGRDNQDDGNDRGPFPFRLDNIFSRREERVEEPLRGRHPRERVHGGRNENENRGARGLGDFIKGIGDIFRGRNRSSSDTVGVGTWEVTSPTRLERRSGSRSLFGDRDNRGSGRGNLGRGTGRTVNLGDRVITPTRHYPGGAGRGTPMPDLKDSGVRGRAPVSSGSGVGGRGPGVPTPSIPIPGQGVPVGGRTPAPIPRQPQVGQTIVPLGTGTITPVRSTATTSRGNVVLGGAKKPPN